MPAALYLCLHLRDFAAQAGTRAHPELRKRPLLILAGSPPLEYVFGLNDAARQQGVTMGMSRVQAESFEGMTILGRERAQEDDAFKELITLANHVSPRVQAIAAPEEQSSAATLILVWRRLRERDTRQALRLRTTPMRRCSPHVD